MGLKNYVNGKPLECFTQRSGMADFPGCYDTKRDLKLEWKNSGSHRKEKIMFWLEKYSSSL